MNRLNIALQRELLAIPSSVGSAFLFHLWSLIHLFVVTEGMDHPNVYEVFVDIKVSMICKVIKEQWKTTILHTV